MIKKQHSLQIICYRVCQEDPTTMQVYELARTMLSLPRNESRPSQGVIFLWRAGHKVSIMLALVNCLGMQGASFSLESRTDSVYVRCSRLLTVEVGMGTGNKLVSVQETSQELRCQKAWQDAWKAGPQLWGQNIKILRWSLEQVSTQEPGRSLAEERAERNLYLVSPIQFAFLSLSRVICFVFHWVWARDF